MRILHLTSHLNVGGVTSSVLSLGEALVVRAHQVAIASGGGEMEPRAELFGMTCWRLPLATSVEFSPQVFAATRRLIKRLRQASDPVDVLHAHTRVGQLVADRVSRTLGIPYVATWHGFFRSNLGRRLWPCLGDRTIAISEPVRQHLRQTFRVPEERIRLIPHGIDPTPFETPPDPSAQARLLTQLGVRPNSRLIGTMARLVPSKGVDQLIRALAHVRLTVPDAALLIVGDGPERHRLERLARTQGVEDRVHFAGTLSETHVALSVMDAFVFLPAEQEGFGLALLEAMASGRPIVAIRRGGGASWVLQESGIGTLVDPDDAQGLALAVMRVLQIGDGAAREGDQGRAIVKERFARSRMVEAVEAVYRELVT